jgi:hypothetical protein
MDLRCALRLCDNIGLFFDDVNKSLKQGTWIANKVYIEARWLTAWERA